MQVEPDFQPCVILWTTEDRMRIARRFNAGIVAQDAQVPKGRQKATAADSRYDSIVPAGLELLLASNPALKRWAIIRCPSRTNTGAFPTRLWSAETCLRFGGLADLSARQSRVQRLGRNSMHQPIRRRQVACRKRRELAALNKAVVAAPLHCEKCRLTAPLSSSGHSPS